jgi:hypothetical protein
MSYLYKATTATKDRWAPNKKTPPIYVVASSKEQAQQMLDRHIRDDIKITRLSKLAAQVSGVMFSGA